jgi:PadR family transcriptional regulator PadR
MEPAGATLPQLRRGVLEFCVMALLRDDERYAFELVRTLGEADGLVTTEGTLYPLLGRLRREGAVETTWRESRAGPPRRYYRLTPHGRDRLDAFTAEWTRFRASVDTMLAMGAPHAADRSSPDRRGLPGAPEPRRRRPAAQPPRRASR